MGRRVSSCKCMDQEKVQKVNKMIRPKSSNHHVYINILRGIDPQKKLLKAFELSSFSKELCFKGLKNRYPWLKEEELMILYGERLDKWHNQNY